MIDTIKRYIQNFPGKSTNRKFLVIESDDWGSIKMPSEEVYNRLQKEGYQPEKDPYLKYDSLASETDFYALYEVLESVKDKNGNPAKITANAVVTNPDFNKIRDNNFSKYEYELFTSTLKKYSNHSKSFQLWKEGMNNKIFWPQYHGREHINVFQWMKSLKEGDKNLLKAFDLNMISISSLKTHLKFAYMEGLDFYSLDERETKKSIIEDGFKVFEEMFGYKSLSYIANCYIWDEKAEIALSNLGVKYLQGTTNQALPILNNKGEHNLKYKYHYFGQKNNLGQRYLVRNAFFEPSQNPKVNCISDCLKRISVAFKCNKPAIIGSHRLNYIGNIHEDNRTKNLSQFKILLKKIIERWPDVEFVSTDELDVIFN